MTKIAILDDYQNVATTFAPFDRLPEGCEVHVLNQLLPGSDEETTASLTPYDVVCCMRERTAFDAARLAALHNLKLLITTGARNASIDVAAAHSRGVVVCGTRAPGFAASELAWALVLGLQRNLVAEDQSMRTGKWQTTVGRDCHGLTLGLVGLGRHGANVARFGQTFGMRCIAWSQNLQSDRCVELGVEQVDRTTLFKTADVISIHLVMGKRNRGLIDGNDLSMMKSDALLINTSRGPIVDEQALLRVLQNGQIGGAGLDVYDQEPLPVDHPLRSCPNTLLTSHVGFVTDQTYRVFYADTLEAIEAWLQGAPVRQLSP